jgi:predicted acylesterase/phospholipase RssA
MRFGLALGGGFARGLAHIGVFSADVARWTIGRMGIAGSDRMDRFLRKLLKCHSFEQMRIPLCVVATGVVTGEAVIFRDRGDVVLPIRASCSYPGLFQPVRCGGRLLVDDATHAISLHLPMQGAAATPTNMFHVINRCFRILHSRTEITWRQHSDLVIEPEVRGMEWDAFHSAMHLMKASEEAARQAAHSSLDRSPTDPGPSAGRHARFKICLTVPLSFWILLCNIISAWMSCSGRGGHPGTYTSIGITWFTGISA